MSDPRREDIWLSLSSEEQEAVASLQQEMGFSSPDAVLHALLRQAAQRALVVCPACGHSARQTAADQASCAECLSVLHLTDGIWQAISLQ